MSELNANGGIQPLMKTLLEEGLLHGECLTVTGQSLAENLSSVMPYENNQDIIKAFDNPIKRNSHLRILYGNLAKEGIYVCGAVAVELCLRSCGCSAVTVKLWLWSCGFPELCLRTCDFAAVVVKLYLWSCDCGAVVPELWLWSCGAVAVACGAVSVIVTVEMWLVELWQ